MANITRINTCRLVPQASAAAKGEIVAPQGITPAPCGATHGLALMRKLQTMKESQKQQPVMVDQGFEHSRSESSITGTIHTSHPWSRDSHRA
jgi:hypothetical protein